MSRSAFHARTGFKLYLAALLYGTTCLIAPATCLSQDDAVQKPAKSVDDAMANMATEVERFLASQGEDSVIVGKFDGPPGVSGDALIVKTLKDKLKDKMKFALANACGVSGSYTGGLDPDLGKYLITIDAQVKDRKGRVAHDLTKYVVTDEATGLTLMGPTVNLSVTSDSPGGSKQLQTQRAKEVDASIDNPQVQISDAQIRAPKSPYGIEILIKRPGGYEPLPAIDERGTAFVDLPADAIYAVRLINDSPHPAGVILSIDGINTLALSENEGFRETGKWVVAPGKSGVIKGWHIGGPKGDVADSFMVKDYGESVAAQLQQLTDQQVGTITAVFVAAWADPKNPPADEPEFARKRGNLATGRGPAVEQIAKPVKLHFGAPRAAVSVRYVRPEPEVDSDLPDGEPDPLAKSSPQ